MTAQPRNENAVVFVCDQTYARFALFMIRQIVHHNPDRGFDIVIYSPDEITLPDWSLTLGVKTIRAAPLTNVPKGGVWQGTVITLYRFSMARTMGHLYRRIIYMDCDMFVDGGDFDRLFRADLGDYPVGGALDANYLVHANHHAKEYRLAGLPAVPYLNSGFQLIDTQAYQEQEVERRAIDTFREYPQAMTSADQSAINLALKGKFAELSPAWNWQRNSGLPLVTLRFPVFVRHFITSEKPDRESKGRLDPRFNLAYREFFGRFDPAYLPKVAPLCDPAPMTLKDAAKIVWRHLLVRELSRKLIARHPDPYQPRL